MVTALFISLGPSTHTDNRAHLLLKLLLYVLRHRHLQLHPVQKIRCAIILRTIYR
jgi:hypothetical protein